MEVRVGHRSYRFRFAATQLSSRKSRFKALSIGFNESREWCPNVAGKHQSSAGSALLEHTASARARLLGIRVLREIPMRVVDLQQVMEDIAREGCVCPATFELEDDMTG